MLPFMFDARRPFSGRFLKFRLDPTNLYLDVQLNSTARDGIQCPDAKVYAATRYLQGGPCKTAPPRKKLGANPWTAATHETWSRGESIIKFRISEPNFVGCETLIFSGSCKWEDRTGQTRFCSVCCVGPVAENCPLESRIHRHKFEISDFQTFHKDPEQQAALTYYGGPVRCH
jgi:hypothetical protein